MYRVSLEGLCKMNYYSAVKVFINYTLSNSRNISRGSIRCSCKKCKNKKFLDLDVVTMHLLQKKIMEKYLCWFTHGEPYVTYEIIVKMMVGSNSSSRNVYEVVDDNSNPYRSMIMDVMRMNQGYAGKCSIIDEEPNTDTTRFFYHLKDFNESLWDECINYSKLSIVKHVFTIKSDYRLNKVGYKKIIEYARNILLKGNRLKENFYAIKSMMKPLELEYQNTKSYIRKLLDKYIEKGENTRMILVSVIEKRGI